MGTRSRIGIQLQDESIVSVYCHYDGYPAFNGKVLRDNYDKEIVRICEDFTSLDPHNKENTITEKLRLIDCYWYNMGYYDIAPPLFPLFK